MKGGKFGWISLSLLFLFLGIFGMAGCWFFSIYNRLVALEEEVQQKFADIQVQYQRRADLIPNLVEVVKGYMKHERELLREITEARARAGQIRVSPENLTPEAIRQFEEAQSALSSALARLLVVVERYPDLKASVQFQTLMTQLEGTENRIAFARNQYNEVVRRYNAMIRQFPAVIVARQMGFEPYPYFEAERSAETTPEISF